MKVLSVQEPYASAIRCGIKGIETRSWKTNYRGKLLIHASRKWYPNADAFDGVDKYRMGVIHCKAELVDCIKMTQEFIDSLPEREIKLGFYEVGRYAWILKNIEPYNIDEQVVVAGHLGLWELTDYKSCSTIDRRHN